MMIGGGPSYKGPRKPAMLRVLVANADDVYQKALDAGAVSTLTMTENFGERFGCVRDRFDNQWIISTQIGPSYSEGLQHSITTFVQVWGAAKFIDSLERGFGAEELMRADGPEGRVRHALIRIGESVIATSDAREEPSPVTCYVICTCPTSTLCMIVPSAQAHSPRIRPPIMPMVIAAPA